MTEQEEKELREAVVSYLGQFKDTYYTPWALDSTGFAYPMALAVFGANWMANKLKDFRP